MITISAMKWAPPFAAGNVRDHRARWILNEAGWPYKVRLIDAVDLASPAYRNRQPFGQVPYMEEPGRPPLFETGAIIIDVATRAGILLPSDGRGRSLVNAWMIAAAHGSGATLAVGQTERYNPAVAAVLPMVTSPRFIEVHRLGVFPDRSLDIDVVFDLMIHDLDIIIAMVRSEVVSLEAVGVPVLTPKYDIANARLPFASGELVTLLGKGAFAPVDESVRTEVRAVEIVCTTGQRLPIKPDFLAIGDAVPIRVGELEDLGRSGNVE